MVLKQENYSEIINSFSIQHWKPLFDLVPKIEKIEKLGDDTEAKKLLKEGIIDMNPYAEHEIIEEFRQVCYSLPIVIDFNWGAWDEGRKMVSDESFDYDSIDIPTKCKIITAILRNDRFNSGVLVSAFESGLMLKILRSIERQFVISFVSNNN